ncbi:MAG: PfkB family carbohydrate kinase, partial [Candidatus Sulfotelmatobacter sp.]
MLRLDSERLGARHQSDYDRLTRSVLRELPDCDAVVLSDYAKGVLTPEMCQVVIEAALKLDILVLVDPKSTDFSRYRGATTICPNLSELSVALKQDVRNLEAVLVAAESIVSALDIEFLMATLSERGIALVRPGNRFLAPAVARQVFDASGAGDTVIAVLALCLASGLKPESAVQLANVAVGIVVGKVGTVLVETYE